MRTGLRSAWLRLRDRLGAPAEITLVGHSHLWAMLDAAAAARPPVRIIDFWKTADPFAQNELELMDQITGPRLHGPVVSVIGGSRHDILTLYRHPRPFDFVLPGERDPHTDERCEIVPLDAVKAGLMVYIQPSLDLLAEVRRRTRGRLFHLDSPPPWGDERRVEDYEDLWDNPSAAFGGRYLRRRMHRLHSLILKEFCAAHDIRLIPAPAEAFDDEGFMRATFHGDLLHANKTYGALAVDQILAAVKGNLEERETAWLA